MENRVWTRFHCISRRPAALSASSALCSPPDGHPPHPTLAPTCRDSYDYVPRRYDEGWKSSSSPSCSRSARQPELQYLAQFQPNRRVVGTAASAEHYAPTQPPSGSIRAGLRIARRCALLPPGRSRRLSRTSLACAWPAHASPESYWSARLRPAPCRGKRARSHISSSSSRPAGLPVRRHPGHTSSALARILTKLTLPGNACISGSNATALARNRGRRESHVQRDFAALRIRRRSRRRHATPHTRRV